MFRKIKQWWNETVIGVEERGVDDSLLAECLIYPDPHRIYHAFIEGIGWIEFDEMEQKTDGRLSLSSVRFPTRVGGSDHDEVLKLLEVIEVDEFDLRALSYMNKPVDLKEAA